MSLVYLVESDFKALDGSGDAVEVVAGSRVIFDGVMATAYDVVSRKYVSFMGWRSGEHGLSITQGHGNVP